MRVSDNDDARGLCIVCVQVMTMMMTVCVCVCVCVMACEMVR